MSPLRVIRNTCNHSLAKSGSACLASSGTTSTATAPAATTTLLPGSSTSSATARAATSTLCVSTTTKTARIPTAWSISSRTSPKLMTRTNCLLSLMSSSAQLLTRILLATILLRLRGCRLPCRGWMSSPLSRGIHGLAITRVTSLMMRKPLSHRLG